jgi:hypothetical protein
MRSIISRRFAPASGGPWTARPWQQRGATRGGRSGCAAPSRFRHAPSRPARASRATEPGPAHSRLRDPQTRPLYRGKPAIISDDYFDEKIVQGTELVENDEYAAFARRIPLPRPPIPRLGRDPRDRGPGSREDVTARAERRALSGSAPPASRAPKRARRTSQHYNSVRIAENRMIKHSSA